MASRADAAMFAITPGSIFELNSHAYTAIAASSTACGLGIACNMWFLLRYSWVDLETFVYRARDIYDSYVFFSLSSRMPTFCMLLSSVSLMAFLGLIACDAWPVGVLVIGILVAFVMILQFIVYGMHQSVTSALRVWRAGMVFIIQGFRCLGSG
ncbi:hypothetical protein M413DRAFT_72188 [Hebeloma cylindrosporum]|uniref:Uncharacterized protein n=1 Tax=Hebeloma cylindrosporum TaxID=76867 RepID=A0A0C3CBB3_HEBCY|nr:hypothetical protein M413DRAFT_72188 [Hebeloma cylindrosporum h7]